MEKNPPSSEENEGGRNTGKVSRYEEAVLQIQAGLPLTAPP